MATPRQFNLTVSQSPAPRGSLYLLGCELEEVYSVVPYQDLPLGPRDRAFDRAEADQRIRRWAGAEDKPNAKYRRGFLYYDPDNPDSFEGYQLPIADVIEGELRAIPRAIFEAAGILEGARGGAAIPEADRDILRGHLTRYYRKLATAFEEASLCPPWADGEHAPLVGLDAYPEDLRPMIVGTALGRFPLEAYEGKVLSGKNKRLVEDAVAALQALLAAAEPASSSSDEGPALTAARLDQLREAELLAAELLIGR